MEVETGFEPVYGDLQSPASPLGHSTTVRLSHIENNGADDGVRTRDLNLGKVPRYQLRYVRMWVKVSAGGECAPISRKGRPKVGAMKEIFWMNGLSATEILEVVNSPDALDRDGFWALHVTYEGEWTCARLGNIQEKPFAHYKWIVDSSPWNSSHSEEEYIEYVESIRNSIVDGDVYQVNACRLLQRKIQLPDDGLRGLFAVMQKNNPAPFASYFNIGEIEVASASPERFLELKTINGKIQLTSSPIKGTSRIPEFGEKDRAENIMIVDLMRNDLGEISESGSIEVPRLLDIEEHPGLFHLVSDVIGTLSTPLSKISEILPAGSISGAPKSAAKKIITTHENQRGSYCGILGYIRRENGEITGQLSVGIRLFFVKNGDLCFGTGAGITWASDSRGEWEETKLKAERLIAIADGRHE